MAFPLDADLDIIVEVYLGADPTDFPEAWPAATDLSSRLLRKPIQIRRGRGTNQKTAQAGSCTLWLDNTDGALTPLLPTSTYYPDWDLGVPIRVSVDGVGVSPPYVRHTGFVVDVTAVMVPGVPGGGNISAVRVTSAGVLRRLGQGAVEKSGLRRFIETSDPYAYWALDDGPLSQSGRLTAGVGGDFTATDWATNSGINPGSTEVASWLGSGLELEGTAASVIAEGPLATVVTPASRLVLDVTFLRNPGSDNSQVMSIAVLDRHTNSETPGSQAQVWAIQIDSGTTEATVSPVLISFFNTSLALSSGTADLAFDSTIPHHLRMDLTQNGADIDAIAYLDAVEVGSGTVAANTLAAYKFRFVRLLHNASVGPDTGASVIYTDVALWVDAEPADIDLAAFGAVGFAGEQAHERFERVCDEEDIPFSGSASSSNECGPQPIATPIGVFQDCEIIDHGMIVEDFGWGLNYIASSQRENLAPTLTIDLATYRTTSGTQGDVLTPVRNDARLRNEWTITRPEGSSSTARDATNIAKRGRYDDSATVNVDGDDRTLDEAQWRVHEGTFDRLRYESLPLDIAANLGS